MPRRRLALVIALVVAAVLGAWLLWPEPPAPSSPGPSRPVPSGRATQPTAVVEHPAPQVDPADAGEQVFVRVVSAVDEHPLPGARVIVERHLRFVHHPGRPLGDATTDASGLVHFAGLPLEDELQVIVRLPYFQVHFDRFVPNVTLALEPLAPARGIVLSRDRVPVAGASITTQGEPMLQTTSGRDGRFTLALASEGFVVGEKNGLLGVGLPRDRNDPNSELEIILGGAPQRTSLVVGRDGKPLEGVQVELRCGAILLRQLTGGDGAWTAPELPDVSATVSFHKAGYVPVELSGSLAQRWKDTVLSRGARLEGRVLDTDRRPLAAVELGLAGMSPSLRPPPATTDAQGRFSFEGLGFAGVVLWATLGERTTSIEVALPDGERTEVTVVLPPQLVRVDLDVVNEDESEVSLWKAVATPVPDPGWSSQSEYGGVDLCRGRFHLVVTADDGRTGELTVDVDPTPEMEPIRVVIPGTPPPPEPLEPFEQRVEHTLQVRVRTPAGEPVEGATVSCVDGSGVTGADGVTSCVAHTVEEDWPLHVIATLGRMKGMTRATGKESMVEVSLRGPRTLRGRIIGTLPVEGVGVWFRSSTQNGDIEIRGNSFTLEGIDPVRTFVCVTHHEPFEELGCNVAEDNDEVVITVGPPGNIELTVLDENGQPLEAPVFYVDRRRTLDESAPKGEAHVEAAPGTHVLVINVEGRRARYETFVTVKSGETTRLGTVRLQ